VVWEERGREAPPYPDSTESILDKVLPELYPKGMKTAISVPNDLFDAAEKLARRLGVSRSRLYSNALTEFLRRHRGDDVTEQLNRLYEDKPAGLDPISEALQGATLGKDGW